MWFHLLLSYNLPYISIQGQLLNLKMILSFLFLKVSEVDLKEPPVCGPGVGGGGVIILAVC